MEIYQVALFLLAYTLSRKQPHCNCTSTCTGQLYWQMLVTHMITHSFKHAACMQIEANLARAAGNGGAHSNSPAPSLLIQQALEAIARISKGFNASLCTRVRPEIGEQVFHQCHFTFCDKYFTQCPFVVVSVHNIVTKHSTCKWHSDCLTLQNMPVDTMLN